MRKSSSQAVLFSLEIVTLKTIKIAVAPVVVASFVSVKGQPIIACARSLFDGDHRAPAAEAAVREVELRFGHAVRVINAVV